MSEVLLHKSRSFQVDDIIGFLLDYLRSGKSRDRRLNEGEVSILLLHARNKFMEQPMLLELGVPVRIVGDIHGQFEDLLRLFKTHGTPRRTNYLFLGDYVDRGRNSVETLTLLLAFKVKYPDTIFLLRGNHESASINRHYGFYDECKRRYTIKLWRAFVDCYECMPVAATIEARIFCCHGGLSPHLKSLAQIASLERPAPVPVDGLMCDLLWSDPDSNIFGFGFNTRGISVTFGVDVVDRFIAKFGFDLICRAHQVVEDGYEFFAKRQLVTIFSAPNYCGEFDNAAASMFVSKDLMISFDIVPPRKVNLNLRNIYKKVNLANK